VNSGRQKNNKLLISLFKQDQADRQPSRYVGNEERVEGNDSRRREIVSEIIRKGGIVTALDHYNAAIIFHHGTNVRDYKIAYDLAKISADLDKNDDALWLCAIVVDRLLLAQGKKQKFGTQYQSVQECSELTGKIKWVMRLSPYDERTSDRTRASLGVPPLNELIAKEVELTENLLANS
jgi:hypothetical protein